jgi:hypothetical protein
MPSVAAASIEATALAKSTDLDVMACRYLAVEKSGWDRGRLVGIVTSWVRC